MGYVNNDNTVVIRYSFFRSYHRRNLSLYHIARAWSKKSRGYELADFEYYGDSSWSGFKGLDFSLPLKPSPRSRVLLPSLSNKYVQLLIDFDYD